METLANLNGSILPLEEVRISALDRGFLFGDAVYEVLRVYQGRPWLEDRHFARLSGSLEAIRLNGVDLPRLRRRMHETLQASQVTEATIYIQITRGQAPRNHAFPRDIAPLEFLFVQEFNDPYREARRQGARAITRPDIRWGRCDIKSTNLLANVLACQEALEAGCKEALLYLPDGRLTEGTHTSLFGVKEGRVITAPRGPDILPGITREWILELTQESGIPSSEEYLERNELNSLAELFLAGTTSEVLPLIEVDGAMIGSGKPGPVTQRLQAAFAGRIKEFVSRPTRN